MESLVDSTISDSEWEAIAAIPTIAKLLSLPSEDAGRHLSERLAGVKIVGMETDFSEGDIFVLYAGEEFPWVVHRRKGCDCPHLHVAFRQL
jgi:hypothetical protein